MTKVVSAFVVWANIFIGIVFPASDAAPYVLGAILTIDGGWMGR